MFYCKDVCLFMQVSLVIYKNENLVTQLIHRQQALLKLKNNFDSMQQQTKKKVKLCPYFAVTVYTVASDDRYKPDDVTSDLGAAALSVYRVSI